MIKNFLLFIVAVLVALSAASYITNNLPSISSSAQAVPTSTLPLSVLTEADIEKIAERAALRMGARIIEQQRSRVAEISGWVFRDRFEAMNSEFNQLVRRNKDDMLGQTYVLNNPEPKVEKPPSVKYLPPDYKLPPTQKQEPKPKNKKEAKAAKQAPAPRGPYLRAAPPFYREGPYPGFSRDY